MQCIKFSCSAASRRSSNGRKTCNGRNMRWCRPSYMPSQEHIDGASPHKDVALHHEPCTSHLRSTLAKNESRRSPISVGHRKFTVQHELTGQCFGPALRQRHRHALVLRQTPAWCQRAWPDERRCLQRCQRHARAGHRKTTSARPTAAERAAKAIVNA